jgi:hypothetical protein
VATKPNDALPVRRYPDHPHPGTTTQGGGTKSAGTRRKEPGIPMRIVRVDTIPMTDEDLDNAAEALAVLLNHFWPEHRALAA